MRAEFLPMPERSPSYLDRHLRPTRLMRLLSFSYQFARSTWLYTVTRQGKSFRIICRFCETDLHILFAGVMSAAATIRAIEPGRPWPFEAGSEPAKCIGDRCAAAAARRGNTALRRIGAFIFWLTVDLRSRVDLRALHASTRARLDLDRPPRFDLL